jgi:hypothetical protein
MTRIATGLHPHDASFMKKILRALKNTRKKSQIALFLEALQGPSYESQQAKTIRFTYSMR